MDVRKKRCSSFPMSRFKNLPDDIIGDILSRLPIKCLLRCRCVCKSWQIITQHKSFIDKHQKRNKCPEIVYEYQYEYRYKLNGKDQTYLFQSTCNGLVLEFNARTHNFRVRNPTTKQVIQLPASVESFSTPVLAFDSSSGNFKIFCLLREEGPPFALLPSIMTIGNDDDLVWRSQDIGMRYLAILKGHRITLSNYDVCYTFKFCSFALNESDIFRFTMDGKSSMKIEVPHSFQWDSLPELGGQDFQVFALDDDKLSIGFIVGRELHLWVLEDYNKHIWSEKKLICLDFIKDYPNPGVIEVWSSPSLSQLRVAIANHIVEYDIYSKKYTCLAAAPPGQYIHYELTPSLVSLKGMRSEQIVA